LWQGVFNASLSRHTKKIYSTPFLLIKNNGEPMKLRFSYKCCIIGALIGFFFFHPLVMLLSHFMAPHNDADAISALKIITSVILKSFSFVMLPWSLSFVFFNGVIGLYYGKAKQENLAKEELILNLQKALAEIKTLSGMLPICAWCKKIKNDEGYWQKIETYIKSHSDADFTHGICNDCEKKVYSDYYQKFEERMKTGK
jgi:hypothetical protein